MSHSIPDPGAGRPPIVPPTTVALGGAGGEEEPQPDLLVSSIVRLVDLLRRADVTQQSDAAIGGALEALDVLSRDDPESRERVVQELERQRADLTEQLELERLVARPPRKGYDLIKPEDDRPVAVEKTIALIDSLLEVFRPKGTSDSHS